MICELVCLVQSLEDYYMVGRLKVASVGSVTSHTHTHIGSERVLNRASVHAKGMQIIYSVVWLAKAIA